MKKSVLPIIIAMVLSNGSFLSLIAQQATPVEQLQVKEGFKVELVYSVPNEQQGSWVALAKNPKGGFTASDQYGRLYQVDPPPIESGESASVRQLPVQVGHAQGLLWAFDSLYAVVNGQGVGGHGDGLYRVTDSDGDGELDAVQLLASLDGRGGEHGPHGIVLSPDGESLYLVAGNHTALPEGVEKSRIPMNWNEDHLLPQLPDANGHAVDIRAPGGWVAKLNPDGTDWEVISTGFRNTYDIAFDKNGELFGYDSDMEYDIGLPWYRPTRVTHITSGSEFGWRTGTGKWPKYYPDSLPAVVEIGPGCPTGIAFGYGANFPARYQDALFISDWTFGTLYAVHLSPDGASYSGNVEQFISGVPLPLTDILIGDDGAMYFTIGGRRVQSGLYRVTYVGNEPTAPFAQAETVNGPHLTRKSLESFHGHVDERAVDLVWKYLGSSDRFIRYAARIALESQPVDFWQSRALKERDPQTLITAMVALARQGSEDVQSQIIAALNGVNFAELNSDQKLELLRAYELTLIRQGRPELELADRLADHIDSWFPSDDPYVNRELVQLLVFLQHPGVIGKTLNLMANEKDAPVSFDTEILQRSERYGPPILRMLENQPHQQGVTYVMALRNLRYGWTLEQREEYFNWFLEAYRKQGGRSYQGFLRNIRLDALANASDAERLSLQSITGETVQLEQTPFVATPPKGPGQNWTVNELARGIESELAGRNFENGKNMFHATACATCHRFDGAGGAVGPDLTSVASRFGYRDLLEAIVEPNKVVSDQYQSSVISKSNGEEIVGRILSESDETLSVSVNPLVPDQIERINRSEIRSVVASPVSQMPEGLLNALNRDEVMDLIAYLVSAGNPQHRFFQE